MLTRFLCAVFIFALLPVPSMTQAQTTQDYLQETPWLGVDQDEARPRGADDSTVGAARALSASTLSLSPTDMEWDNVSEWKRFTLTNTGGMATSTLTYRTDHNRFAIDRGGCGDTLAGGASCDLQLRPNAGGEDRLTISAQFGGTVSATLRMGGEGDSCLQILQSGSHRGRGVYRLNDPAGGYYEAWCDMDTAGGGWTLVMRFRQGSQTLHYDALYWETEQVLNAENPQPASDGNSTSDAKYKAYNHVSGSILRVQFKRSGSGLHDFDMVYNRLSGRTPLQLFRGGRDMIAGTLRNGCNGAVLTTAPGYDPSFMNFGRGHQFFGINIVDGSSSYYHRVRFGYGSNDEATTPARGNIAVGEHAWWQGNHRYDSIHLRTTRPDCASCGGCYGDGSALSGPRAAANMWVR